MAAPPLTRRAIPDHYRVQGHHENDQAVVVHEARVFEDPLQQPRPRRQGSGVIARRRPDTPHLNHLGQVLGRLGMVGHPAEGLFIEAQHLHVADGSHSRVAWTRREQTDFAEVLAWRERADVHVAVLNPLDDLRLA